ncbi:MAG: hypothetical protein AAB019_09475 [Planctomycetota bacterium]
MLNELYKLKCSLEKCGIITPQKHPSIRNAGKKEGLILYIDDSGINSLDYVDKTTMDNYWKITESNQHNFPIFKLDVPIYETKMLKEELKKIFDTKDIKKVEQILQSPVFTKKNKKLAKRIYEYPKEILDMISDDCPKENTLGILINRLINLHKQNNLLDDKWFLKQLTRNVLSALKEGKLKEWSIAETIFFGVLDDKKNEVLLVLDVADYMQRGQRVSGKETMNEINEILLKITNSKVGVKKKDAFGSMQEIENEKFPNPKLPEFGLVYLFSMNKDAKCHQRYKRISSSIFPVGKNLRIELGSALQNIAKKERKGKTWKRVPSNKGKQSDLLITYLENRPENEIGIASLFSDASGDEEMEISFEESSSTVCKALAGIDTRISDHVQLLVLSKFDTGRTQIILNERYSTAQIVTGVHDWNSGAKNHPEIYLYIDNEQMSPKSLSPAEFMRVFHSQWIRQGLDSHGVIGVPLRDVYDVFLGNDNIAKRTAEKMLYTIIQRNTALLLGIGGAQWSNKWEGYGDSVKDSFLKVVSAISILLWKLKIRKEEYMAQVSFYVGRMLALADTLHREYCLNVRAKDKTEEEKKKSLPRQLIGNSLITTALDNPEKGLARLSERLPIYQAWAQTVQGDDVGLAKWVLSELGEVSTQLKELSVPKTAGDAERAQILLGYLARTKSSNENK